MIGGVGLFFYDRSGESWKKRATTGKKKIVDFPLNDVSHVTIKTSEAN